MKKLYSLHSQREKHWKVKKVSRRTNVYMMAVITYFVEMGGNNHRGVRF